MKQNYTMPDGETVEKDMPQWKTPWNHDTNFESDRTALYCNDRTLTKQEFKDETDINNIINRFLKTGEPPAMAIPEHFVDATTQLTYLEMQERLAEANANFYQLPPNIRAEYLNSPERWADAAMKALEQADGERLRKMGIDINFQQQKPPEPQQKPPEPSTPTGGSPAPVPAAGASEAPKTA